MGVYFMWSCHREFHFLDVNVEGSSLRRGQASTCQDAWWLTWSQLSPRCDWARHFFGRFSVFLGIWCCWLLRAHCVSMFLLAGGQPTPFFHMFASVHTWHMSKPVVMFVFKVLRNGLLRYILDTCITFVFKVLRNALLQCILDTFVFKVLQNASVHTWHMYKPVISFVFDVLRNGLLRYILWHMYNVRFQSATECTASVHTWHMSKPVVTFVFKVLQNASVHNFDTCPNLWYRSCSTCCGMDCFGTYLTHVQTCDIVCVRSATECTASVHTWHMSKPVVTFVFKGTYLTHVQTCDIVCVRSATECTASVHTWHMSKPVVTFVFKVLQNASVHIWHMSKPVMTFVFKVLRNGLLRYILDTCPNLR